MTDLATPTRLFGRVAVAEAVTWALLLVGMFLKYVTDTTDAGVRVFGMVHGVVFLAYAVVTVLVAIDQRWPFSRVIFGLAAAVPPFATILFDRVARTSGWLGEHWRLLHTEPETGSERAAAWILRQPARGAAVGAAVVLALTAIALLAGPPVG